MNHTEFKEPQIVLCGSLHQSLLWSDLKLSLPPTFNDLLTSSKSLSLSDIKLNLYNDVAMLKQHGLVAHPVRSDH